MRTALVLASGALDPNTKEDLETFYRDLNPVDLLRELRTSIRRLQQAEVNRRSLWHPLRAQHGCNNLRLRKELAEMR